MGKTRETKFKTVNRQKRRMDLNQTAGKKNILVVDESKLDRDKFVYHIVNDEPGNIAEYEALDYDVVHDNEITIGDEDAAKATHDGSVVRVDVGGGKTAVLMSKPKEWYESDQLAKEKRLRDMDKKMEAKNKQDYEKFT